MNMHPVVKQQLNACIKSTWFRATLAIALTLSIAAAIETIVMMNWRLEFDDFYLSQRSAWANWIVVNANFTSISTVLINILPLLCSLSFAWSFNSDVLSGYASQVISRSSKFQYVLGKTAAVFVSGAMIAATVLVSNILLLLAVLPANIAYFEDCIILGVFPESLFCSLFYNKPFLFVICYTLLDSFLMGVWSVFCLATSAIFRDNRILVVILPFIGLYGWKYLNTQIVASTGISLPSLNIIDELDATFVFLISEYWAIAIQVLCLLALVAIGSYLLIKRDVR